MFDMLIGDWDRHDDQWRWAEFKKDDNTIIYKPIPRDRDQAFSNFDGGFMGALRSTLGFSKKFQVYDDEVSNAKWINSAATILDRTLVQNSGKKEWFEQAKFIKENLSDKAIENAFMHIPKEARGADLDSIISKLKGRRENLVTVANDFYAFHAELAIINGTDKDDYFTIERLIDGKTKVTVQRIKGGEKKDLISERVYDKKYTKQIRIYGLDDDDVFEIIGESKKAIPVRIVGGQNNDTYIVEQGKRLTIYDHKTKPNTIKKKGNARIRFTDDYDTNIFDKDDRELSTSNILPAFGYNPDDGFKIGPMYIINNKDFNQNPFTQQHKISASVYFATLGFDLNYSGEFAGVLGDYNLLVKGLYTSPNYAVNFFGFGNNSINRDDENGISMDYNRVKLSQYKIELGATKSGLNGSYFEYSISIEGNKIDETSNRFIDDFEFNDPDIFERKWFAGLNATYKYESYDVVVNPTRGMKFELNGGTKTNTSGGKTYGFIKPYLGFYNALINNRKLILKTAASSQLNIGKQYQFYQSAQLGGENLLRGYRKQRFSGQRSFAGSADIRYSFNQFKTRVLPLQIGVFAGADTGRVWLNDFDDNNKWHYDYGGGIWINSADALSTTFNLFTGEDGPRFSFNFLLKI